MTEAVVLCEVDTRGVASVTLNRPQVNNAYNGELIAQFLDVVASLRDDRTVRVVVLRGNGRHFQAGADLRWIDEVRESGDASNEAVSRRTAEAVRQLNELPLPTVALVQGGCFGGGIGVIAACDVVIAEREAVFAISEARWGLHASIIVPQLNGAMGLRQVRRYALTCERFGAERARELGLVHEVCDVGGLDQAGGEVVEALLACDPQAIAETKAAALEHGHQVMSAETFDALVDSHWRKRVSDAAREGLASFREKRPASWYPAPD